MNDRQREQAIEAARLDFLGAESRDDQVAAWNRMAGLILGRSPERVRQMEMEKGLR